MVDEALTDFLSVYNPMVCALRARFPFLLLPTFTFRGWLTGLVLAVVVLAGLFCPGWIGAGLLFAVVAGLLVVLLITARGRTESMHPGVILVRLVILTAFLALAVHKVS